MNDQPKKKYQVWEVDDKESDATIYEAENEATAAMEWCDDNIDANETVGHVHVRVQLLGSSIAERFAVTAHQIWEWEAHSE